MSGCLRTLIHDTIAQAYSLMDGFTPVNYFKEPVKPVFYHDPKKSKNTNTDENGKLVDRQFMVNVWHWAELRDGSHDIHGLPMGTFTAIGWDLEVYRDWQERMRQARKNQEPLPSEPKTCKRVLHHQEMLMLFGLEEVKDLINWCRGNDNTREAEEVQTADKETLKQMKDKKKKMKIRTLKNIDSKISKKHAAGAGSYKPTPQDDIELINRDTSTDQVCGLRFSRTWNKKKQTWDEWWTAQIQYAGDVDQTIYRRVDKSWVEDNFGKEEESDYVKHTKSAGRAGDKRYVRVVGGAPRTNLPDFLPKDSPELKYKQEEDEYTCMVDSLASALAYLGLGAIAAELHQKSLSMAGQVGQDTMVADFVNEQTQCARQHLTSTHNLLDPDNWSPYPKVVQLLATDCGVQHAITVVGGWIFDSTCPRALPLCKESLDWCCSAADCKTGFAKVYQGYHLRPEPPSNFYCWTHGYKGHRSEDCQKPNLKAGHQADATHDRNMGGSRIGLPSIWRQRTWKELMPTNQQRLLLG